MGNADGAPPRPSVTVVVPVKDGSDGLHRCLTALAAQRYPRELLDVVVVDNGSTEDVGAVVASHPPARLLRQPRGGSYAARNTGIDASDGEVLAFTDADCEPLPTWVSAAVEALGASGRADGEPEVAMVGGAVQLTYRHGHPVTACELFDAVRAFPQQQYLERYRFAVTANMVTRRTVLDAVGPFDEELFSGGDFEWGTRVASAGLVQRYAPAAVVRHPARDTWSESVRKWRRVAAGRLGTGYRTGRVRHDLVQFVWREVRAAVLEVGRSRHHPQLTTPLARARYLLAHTVHRVVTVATVTPRLLQVLAPGRGTVPPAAPPAGAPARGADRPPA